ncbi:MBL fold metallo-hydrolase [Marispirochaeta aestuarii]|uniref:MBL fold metallo-hydrolase n=1 Tax=Marispirochaeta aestuarii TaxID=1963862 RepID=UPI0029C62559|nr:MBL fold metallo-hydrolase [Marispirochaeta aestuarii]
MKKAMQKTILTVLLIILLIFSGCADEKSDLAVVQLTEKISITEIEDKVFLVTHSFPWPGNSLFLVLDKENILWIDTPYTPEATALVLDWIEKEIGKQYSITEINTGFHIDNLGGNQELINRNIPIYGSSLTCKLLDNQSRITMSKMMNWLKGVENKKYRDVYSDFQFFRPTRTFDINEEQRLTFGSEEVVIYYPGPTHTYDNLLVYIPGRKLLFGGCMILSADADKVGFVEDGNLQEWAKSLLKLEERFESIRIVIPGHGNPGSSALIEHTKDVVNAALSD